MATLSREVETGRAGGKRSTCSLIQHLSEERRLIRVFAPDSQWPRTAVELGRGRGRVWKPLLQNVHTFFTYSTTGPV